MAELNEDLEIAVDPVFDNIAGVNKKYLLLYKYA
jgi:hypothetical protein